MVNLQGFTYQQAIKDHFGTLDRMSDIEALVAFIASKSNGMKMNVPLSHQKEYDTYKAGEYVFYRRNGPTDFGCITCHGDNGKRIRLQDLPNMTDQKQIQAVASTCPRTSARRARYSPCRTVCTNAPGRCGCPISPTCPICRSPSPAILTIRATAP